MRRVSAILLFLLVGGAAQAESSRTLTLEQAVELAIQAEPIVAEARIQEGRTRLGVLRAQLERVSLKIDGQLQELWQKSNIFGPQIPNLCILGNQSVPAPDQASCSAVGGTWIQPDQSPSASLGSLNLTAQLNVPLFTGFRITSDVKRAEIAKEAAIVQIRQNRKDTALAVARAYWQVRRIELLRDVQATSLGRLRDAEAVADGRSKAGLAPPIDVNRARLRRIQQEATLADLEGQSREALAQLGVTLGIGDTLTLSDPVEIPEGAPPPVGELLDSAHKGRPELITARLSTAAQHLAIRLAQSTYYPQLNAFGNFQYTNNPFLVQTGSRSAPPSANPFSNLSGNLTLGATLSMNFFDTLSTWSAVQDARFEESRLVEEERRFRRVIDSDVRFAHAKVLHLVGRRAPLLVAVDVARDNALILEGRYKNGDALIIELLDAQNELATAELQLSDVSSQLKLAWLELDAALGKTIGENR